MYFTAQISRNFRDVATGVPKCLLRNIVNEESDEEFRDHAWVEVTPALKKFFEQKLIKNSKRVISFEADKKVYEYRGQEFKRTLENVRNIKVLGRA